MNDSGKITSSHRSRAAVIYVRQSTLIQLERNTESTARQYDLVHRAGQLGWPREAIRVVDADLGVSGSVLGQREGYESLVAEVALGQVGIILALEASRLARDNAAWYRLLELAGVCDTLVADADGVYHPALFADRLLLGLMGIMAESELHVLRARLDGGIKNKAARGELRRGLPVGLIWGEADGEVCFHPDEAVTGVIAATFDRFAVSGSVRATWLWLRAEGLRWPLQKVAYTRRGSGIPEITWVEPTYHAVHTTLTHPAYAGAYVYGRTRKERYLDPGGALRQRARRQPPIRTDEDTIGLIRRLAVHYPDAVIAGILNRQHRRTARGLSYTASRVQSLRYHWHIPCHQPDSTGQPPEGEPLNVTAAARQLGIAPSTLLRG
jgi:DNA invertase Pin-like site-specific DNA recombinase